MRILLINPLLAPKRKPAVYNIGLGYIASSLVQDGHKAVVLDIEGYKYQPDKVLKIIKNTEFDVIGIGTIITGYRYVKWLVKEIKKIKPDKMIWLGNSISSTIPQIVLKDMDIDVAVIGEGENTVKELAKVVENNGDLSKINGICYKSNRKIIQTPKRELIPNIDTIPFPAWELFPQHIYMNNRTGFMPTPTAYISTVRGCPYHCTYCYHPFQNERIRWHSAERIIEEIKILKNKYKIRSVLFADDLFITNKKRLYEVCDLIEKEKLNISWTATARVNLLEQHLLKRMKSAGCVCLNFGIESGSQKILDNIKKQVTVDQAKQSIMLCKKVGIYPACSFMIGNIGETKETISETVSFIVENISEPIGFFLTTPYPGTELFEYAKQQSKIKSEIELFESYGEQAENLLVNFTNMSDEELLELKKEAEMSILKYYGRNHILKYIFILLVRLYRAVISNYRQYGIKETIKKIIIFVKKYHYVCIV